MRFLRQIVLSLLCFFIGLPVTQAAEAPKPAADVALFSQAKKPSIPADKLQATYQSEPIGLPPKPWKIPEATLDLTGQGVSIYYLIPYKRVKGILPKALKPYPGPDDIWFRVDVIHWTSIRPRSTPGKQLKKFVELTYRFEVIKNGSRGSYPLRMYLDTAWPVLWTRHFGSYDAYPVQKADVNFSPFIHFFQTRRGKLALAVVDVNVRQGMGARMNDLFGRKDDAVQWAGNSQDFVVVDDLENTIAINRKFETEIKNGEVRSLLLAEPVKWKILHEDEVIIPNKILIFDSIFGTWTGDASRTVKTSESSGTSKADPTTHSDEIPLGLQDPE